MRIDFMPIAFPVKVTTRRRLQKGLSVTFYDIFIFNNNRFSL